MQNILFIQLPIIYLLIPYMWNVCTCRVSIHSTRKYRQWRCGNQFLSRPGWNCRNKSRRSLSKILGAFPSSGWDSISWENAGSISLKTWDTARNFPGMLGKYLTSVRNKIPVKYVAHISVCLHVTSVSKRSFAYLFVCLLTLEWHE